MDMLYFRSRKVNCSPSRLSAWLAVAGLLCLARSAAAQTLYAVTPIGRFTPIQISQSGMVVGQINTSYAWDVKDGLMQIPGFSGQDTAVWSVNSSGQAVGSTYLNSQGDIVAFVWDRVNGTRQIDDFQGGSTQGWVASVAYTINGPGHIVGYLNYPQNPRTDVAFLWKPGQGYVTLPPLVAGFSTAAELINAGDEIVGLALDANLNDHAVIWNPDGTIVDIGNMPGRYENEPSGINDAGYICGWDQGAQNTISYLRNLDGSYVPLVNPYNSGYYVWATAIDSRNTVVGCLENLATARAGFMWNEQSGYRMINDCLAPGSNGWNISEVHSINDAGQMAALGYLNGTPQAVLLTPVQPVAGTVALRNYAASAVAGTLATVDLRSPGSTTPLDSHVVALDSGGNFSFTTALPAGTYDVAVKASHWLRRTQHNVVVGSGGSLSFSLINGDINGDNTISLADFGQLKAAYGSMSGNSNWNPNADLDGNGSVGLSDFGILKLNYGMTGDP